MPRNTTQEVTIGFVGKRRLPAGEEALRASLEQLFDTLEKEFPGPGHTLVGLSALALGADTVFAEVVARRGAGHPAGSAPPYAQRIFLPAPPAGFFLPDDFQLAEAEPATTVLARLARSAACLHGPLVREVFVAGTADSRDERFAETAFAIVDACDLLVVACTRAEQAAVFAGLPASGLARGGSAETLQYAYALGKRLMVLEVDAPAGPNGQLPAVALPARTA